jgi:hypothetical protein
MTTKMTRGSVVCMTKAQKEKAKVPINFVTGTKFFIIFSYLQSVPAWLS